MSAGASGGLSALSRDELRTAFALTVWSVLTLIAAVLVARRVGGAFPADIGAGAPCIGATLAVLVSLAANAVWCTVNAYASSWKQFIAAALTLVPPLATGCALWSSHSAMVGGYLGGLGLVAALATVVIHDLSKLAGGRVRALAVPIKLQSGCCPKQSEEELLPIQDSTSGNPAVVAVSDSLQQIEESVNGEAEEPDPSILQWMTRRQLDHGAEAVEGSVRIHFGPGERSATAHVSFSPPLCDRPRAECQALVDFGGRVRIGVAQSYGLRIEARRTEPAREAASVDVGFSAQVQKAQNAAA